MNFRFWKCNKIWITLTLALWAGVWVAARLGSDDVIGIPAQLGVLFLLLVLVPANLLKLRVPVLARLQPPLARLVRNRRELGITAGIQLCTHAFLAIQTYSGFTWANLSRFVTYRPILLGALSLFIILAMLATSHQWTTKRMGKYWKPLHSLVWLVVPFGFTHALLSSSEFMGELPTLALVGFGTIAAFVLFEAGWLQAPTKHTRLLFVGILIALAVWEWYGL